MKLDLATLGLLGYAAPAISAPYALKLLGYELSNEAQQVVLLSAISATIGWILGWLLTHTPRKKNLSTPNQQGQKIRRRIAHTLLIIGLVAIIVNFALAGTIPLLSNNESRTNLQNSSLWNIYIFCSIGLLIHSNTTISHNDQFGRTLAISYLLSALLTAWKGTLFNFALLLIVPKLKNRSISATALIAGTTVFLLIFIFINGARGSGFVNALAHPIYYAYWGFANFDNEAISSSSSCIHSIPIIGCRFEVANEELINSAYNVFTALSPLYIDGGAALVSTVFFLFGFLLKFSQSSTSSPIQNYLFYLALYFLLFASNGYIFYSSFYFSALAALILIELSLLGRNIKSTNHQNRVST